MKYYIQETNRKGNEFYAASKARNDCDKILQDNGYQAFYIPISGQRLLRPLIRIYYILKLKLKLKKGDTLFIQYPYYSLSRIGIVMYKLLLSGKYHTIECLIHDINYCREQNKKEPELHYTISKCNKIIVHTPNMKKLFIEKFNIDPNKIRVLHLFDYLSQQQPIINTLETNTVIFAGNLTKSSFISKLSSLNDNIHYNLYGVGGELLKPSNNYTYLGKFAPDNINDIKGDWGLVWDGDSIDTCNGKLGEYLKINASHKASLYIAACKPVIIWEESSLKEFILKNKLGIIIRSLKDIPYKIENLSVTDKKEIMQNVLKYSLMLRQGYFLSSCLTNKSI